jgi:hypothetical protein
MYLQDMGMGTYTISFEKNIHFLPKNDQIIWSMGFNSAKFKHIYEGGVFLCDPKRNVIPLSFQLEFPNTNNMVEYEALV